MTRKGKAGDLEKNGEHGTLKKCTGRCDEMKSVSNGTQTCPDCRSPLEDTDLF